MHMLTRIYYELLAFLFPSRTGVVWEQIQYEDIAARYAITTIYSVTNGVALLPYRDPRVRELLWTLKYRGKKSIAKQFGTLLAHYINEQHTQKQNLLLVPVPLSQKRLRERGFNQTESIVRACVDKIPHLSYSSNLLVRTKDNEHQARLSRKKRLENIKGAFAVDDPDNMLADAHIILVDDVVTTGATLAEARSALIQAGARQVTCVAIAH